MLRNRTGFLNFAQGPMTLGNVLVLMFQLSCFTERLLLKDTMELQLKERTHSTHSMFNFKSLNCNVWPAFRDNLSIYIVEVLQYWSGQSHISYHSHPHHLPASTVNTQISRAIYREGSDFSHIETCDALTHQPGDDVWMNHDEVAWRVNQCGYLKIVSVMSLTTMADQTCWVANTQSETERQIER